MKAEEMIKKLYQYLPGVSLSQHRGRVLSMIRAHANEALESSAVCVYLFLQSNGLTAFAQELAAKVRALKE